MRQTKFLWENRKARAQAALFNLVESTQSAWNFGDGLTNKNSKDTVMHLVPAIAFGLLIASSVPAFAYTQEDSSACISDAFRLCSSAIPDQQQVASCLYRKRRELSPACAGAFARYSRTGVRRHHRHRPYVSND